MDFAFDGPTRGPAFPRRASTDNSIGLDYQNTHPVDDDILSRIRALLLSRNGHRPPLTPHTSEENPARSPRDNNPTQFDFSTAKSISKLARKATNKMKPGMTRSLSKSADMANDRRPSQSPVSSNLARPLLRTSSSVNDMRGPYDHATVYKTNVAKPSASIETPKKSWFPKLVLRDIKAPETAHKSCVEISKFIPPNDLELHEDELACCPPCVPLEPHESKYMAPHTAWPGKELMAEPADLVCFLAGCPPGHLGCKKQHRLPSMSSRQSSQGGSSQDGNISRARSRTTSWTRSSARHRYSVVETRASKSRSVSLKGRKDSNRNGQQNLGSNPKFTLAAEDVGKNSSSPMESSPRSSITSADKFPHALISMDTVANEGRPTLFSTAIATNFSLSGPRAKSTKSRDPSKVPSKLTRALPGPTADSTPWKDLICDPRSDEEGLEPKPLVVLRKESSPAGPSDTFEEIPVKNVQTTKVVQSKPSNDSLRDPRPASPSLRSGASRTSSYRHLLLKPSVTESQPVDNGLPVPPVLSTTTGMSEFSMPPQRELFTVKESPHAVKYTQQEVTVENMEPEIVVPLDDLIDNYIPEKLALTVDLVHEPSQKADDISNNVKTVQLAKAQDFSNLHSICLKEAGLYRHIKERTREAKDKFQASIANDGGNSSVDNRSSTPEVFPSYVDPASPAPSSHAAYWGFVPTVKEVVHDAVNLAVRNVVSEAVMPPGPEKQKAARAYRRAVADSLAEAAKDVDAYLRRPSLWKDPEPHDSLLPHDALVKPCHRLSCLDDPHIVHCNSVSCGKRMAPEPTPEPVKRSPNTWRGNDCEICHQCTVKVLTAPADLKSLVQKVESPMPKLEIPADLKIQIPQQPADEKPPVKQVPSRKASRALRKGSAVTFSGVPDRGSSRQRSSARKTPDGKLVGSHPKQASTPRSQRRPYDPLGFGSHQTVSSVESPDDTAKKDMPEQSLLPRRIKESEADSFSFLPSNERLGRKNTVHWLRDLLSSTGPYEPRLTALPPRTRRGQDSSATKLRAQTAPSIPVKLLYLGATPKPKTPAVQSISKALPGQDPLIPAALSKTIGELEDLLSEALVITRRAADGKGYQAYRKVEPEKQNMSKARALKKSDEISLIGSIHESMRSFSGSSDGSDDSMEEDTQIRQNDLTVEKQSTFRDIPSGWPPTGRAATPYPPNTRRPSKDSVEAETADREDITSSADSKTPSSIVRKIDPRLRSIGPALRAATQISFGASPKKDEPIEFENLEPFNSKRPKHRQTGIESYSPGRLSPEKTPVESDHVVSRTLSNPPAPLITDRSGTVSPVPLPKITPRNSQAVCRRGHSEDDHIALKQRLTDKSVPSKREVRDYILEHRRPPIHVRESSTNSRKMAKQQQKESQPENRAAYKSTSTGKTYSWQDIDQSKIDPCSHIMPERAPRASQLRSQELRPMSIPYSHSLDGTQFTRSEEVDFDHGYSHRQRTEPGERPVRTETAIVREREIELRDVVSPNLPTTTSRSQKPHMFNLKNKRHVSLRDLKGFSLARSHKRQSIARDWSPGRKRFCAAVACLSTALVGILVGIYAGETPAIQYWIVDFHHYTVLGNVFFFIGLSIPSFLFWPLPLLHGRKPYILGAMSLAMPLLFPQALAVGELRSPYTHIWRVALILPRAFMGLCLGFANMNCKGILTDLFGASLQSTNPHQEHVDEFDVRRHGGGMGVWLGLWTWSAMGSIGVGFLIGGAIINNHNPAWGFYISIVIIAIILLLNVLTPEVRRSAFRRSVAEVKNNGEVSRRLARGEVKMHMVQTGPKWWGEEFHYGMMLSLKMLRQPGFMVMAAYVAWIYGQIVLIVLLLGSLCSNTYKFQSPQVGLAVASVPLGAFVAIPFQKASIFSRERNHAPKSDDDTYKKKVKWSSHFIRRAIFVLTLPFAGLGYTLSSGGAHIPFILPILFAALIGFLSNLAMAECHGIIMETFDTSDLSPGMTGRSRGSAGGKPAGKRTNYSSFPRVASAFGITQGLGYLIGAIASGVGGSLTRNLGQQTATGVMAFILLVLSLLLLGVLVRFKDVQIIPDSKKDEMDRYHNARRTSASRRDEGIQEEEPWRPIIIGNPHHSTRRMCILELGSMSRFSEIRLKNRLVDEQSLEARHPNQQLMIDVRQKIKEKETEIVYHVRRSLSRQSSRGSRRSVFSDDDRGGVPEQGDLGGHREIGRMVSEKKGKRPTRRATGIRE